MTCTPFSFSLKSDNGDECDNDDKQQQRKRTEKGYKSKCEYDAAKKMLQSKDNA